MLLTSPLAWRAAVTPRRTALCAAGRTVDYATLVARAARTADALHAHGIARGDRVALLLGNEPLMVDLVHAAAFLGVVLVPLNARLTPDEISFQLEHAGARCLVHGEGALATAATRAAAVAKTSLVLPGERLAIPFEEAAEHETMSRRAEIETDDDAFILYTSGTRGRPRGVRLSYGNRVARALASALHLGAPPEERWLACMPLFHVGGLSILVRSALTGGSVVLHERFDPPAVNRALDEDDVTMVSLVGAMLQRVLDDRGDRPAPRTLRGVLLGGGPAAPALIARARALGFRIATTYGLTEAASQVATLPLDESDDAPIGCAGRILFGSELRIADASGAALPAGAEGEILVRGPTVMAGYVGDAAASERALAGGWLHTGDIGRLDAEGRLFVLDRRSDLVVSGGENVYPAEVEGVLAEHPAVAEVAVTGRPDDRLGQRVVAFVVLREGRRAEAAELEAHARTRLAGFKVPRRWHFVSELPRTASGKLVRRALVDLPD